MFKGSTSRRVLIQLECSVQELLRFLGKETRVFMSEHVCVAWDDNNKIIFKDVSFRNAAIEGNGIVRSEGKYLSIHVLMKLQPVYKLGVIVVHILFGLSVLGFIMGLLGNELSIYKRLVFTTLLGGMEYIARRQVDAGFTRMEHSLRTILGKGMGPDPRT